MMKNINDCLKQISAEYGLKYISYGDGRLIQLINRNGKSVAVYDHYFPLNSDTTAKICEDRGLCNKLLNLINIKTDTNFEFVFSSCVELFCNIGKSKLIYQAKRAEIICKL